MGLQLTNVKRLFLFFALVIATFAAVPTVAEGYVHRGQAVTVTVEVWAHTVKAPRKEEPIRLSLTISPEQKFRNAADFLVRAGYAEAEANLRTTEMELPDLRLMGSTAVRRGDEKVPVASSGRQLSWPKEFQLRDGDVIQISEFVG